MQPDDHAERRRLLGGLASRFGALTVAGVVIGGSLFAAGNRDPANTVPGLTIPGTTLLAIGGAGLVGAGVLFRVHAPRLLPMLVHLLASRSDAEDALQDAFVEAFRDLGKLDDISVFAGWLRRIAAHQAHRRFRRRRLLGALGLDRAAKDATLEELADADASPEMRTELSMIDRTLRKMPTDERVAWILRHVEGYELSEVASAWAARSRRRNDGSARRR